MADSQRCKKEHFVFMMYFGLGTRNTVLLKSTYAVPLYRISQFCVFPSNELKMQIDKHFTTLMILLVIFMSSICILTNVFNNTLRKYTSEEIF